MTFKTATGSGWTVTATCKRVTNPDSRHRNGDTGQCGDGNKVTGIDAGRDSGAWDDNRQDRDADNYQDRGDALNVTVNAVDANWNVASNTDTVSITSSDTYATLPANAALVGGTKDIQCDFQDSDRQWLDGDGHLRKRGTNPDSQHRNKPGQCGNGNKVTGIDAGRDSGAWDDHRQDRDTDNPDSGDGV